MKINKKTIILTCSLITITSLGIVSTINNLSTTVEASSPKIEIEQTTQKEYIDTKHKSADTQTEISLGLLYEIPLYKGNEKIKNILYVNSSKEHVNNESLLELKNICLDSPYLYDEVYIQLEEDYCLKYNPFSDELLYGTIDNQYSFSTVKEIKIISQS